MLRDFFNRLKNGPYKYKPGYNTLGIGADNMALVSPGFPQLSNFYSPKYLVQGDLKPFAPGYAKTTQEMPDTSLKANGAYLSGEIALAALSEFNAKVENG